MCALAGFLNQDGSPGAPRPGVLADMLRVLAHRGPDETGFYESGPVGLAHARLAIVGLSNGRQPLANEDESVRLIYAGEIFNHRELRAGLEKKGHRFRTDSDGEVVAHLYEEEGMDFLAKLNGQFAFALWDSKKQELILCRDRVGILPLFYAVRGRTLYFASEIKAFFEAGFEARLDPIAIDQIFTFWTTLAPRTAFEGVSQVRPGCYLRVSGTAVRETPYWRLSFPEHGAYDKRDDRAAGEELRALLEDAVAVRLEADVPVGIYLSGGLDSSAVAAMASRIHEKIASFSVRFDDPRFDEGGSQKLVAEALGFPNRHVLFSEKELEATLDRALRGAECPALRTAFVPLYALSALVRSSGFKAVVGGEGADEILLGYDLFKETKIRQFCARRPDSVRRASLFKRLYPYLPSLSSQDSGFLSQFFAEGAERTDDPFYSHRVRWHNTARLKRFFSDSFRERLGRYDALEDLRASLPGNFRHWDPMARAQYLEINLFLANYLLSTQGDRMAMAHSVEVRYPYLDHRVIELANRIPPALKMRGLREKRLLKRAAQNRLPASVLARPKYPYRSPGKLLSSLWSSGRYSRHLSGEAVSRAGIFDGDRTGLLTQKLARTPDPSEADQMAACGVLTVQMLAETFSQKEKARA